jgi:4-amino-4-deoxy-L-arabinose transferase-like glycosyltransferase
VSLPDAHKYSVSRSDVWAAVALLSIVGTALLLRRLFVTGIVFLDDLVYTHAAHDLLNGRLHVQDWPTAPTRVGLYAPVALSYLLLGTTESAALLFPLVSSLASLFVVYAIGRLLADERAGLIAAFLWAVFPIDVQMAGALLPDGPLAMLSATAVWLFLRARLGRGRHASVGYGLAFFCLSIAVLVKPLALIVVPFALCYLVVEQPNKIRPSSALSVFLLASLSLLVLATLTLSAYYYVTHVPALAPFTTRLAVTATDWTHRLLSERAFAAFIPLALRDQMNAVG